MNHFLSKNNQRLTARFIIFSFIILLTVVIFRTAWISDDAYITFRTVHNFVNGYGLTWNVGERVQTYTHPLWMFLLSLFYFFTGEIYYTSILLSIVVTLIAVYILAFKIALSSSSALIGILVLILSKSFIDYSTSGLENPMTHLLLAIFLFLFFNKEYNPETFFILSAIAGLAALNRMDTILFFIPVLVYLFFKIRKSKKLIFFGLAGFSPFILWEIFSLFYYGFPFPNTAYAKLNTGISHSIIIESGIDYILFTGKWDHIAILIISIGFLIPFIKRKWKITTVSLGLLLYMDYIIYVGGDFMLGRFLTAPLFCATIIICRLTIKRFNVFFLLSFIIITIIGFTSSFPTLLSGPDYINKKRYDKFADERGHYYIDTGMMRRDQSKKVLGKPNNSSNNEFELLHSIGRGGFIRGSNVYILDVMASLSDPLLARLPAENINYFRPGHILRALPPDYLESLKTGSNRIMDKNLHEYYDKLLLIVRGNLFAPKRLVEIWKMNTGYYDHLIKAYLKNDITSIKVRGILSEMGERAIYKHNYFYLQLNFSKYKDARFFFQKDIKGRNLVITMGNWGRKVKKESNLENAFINSITKLDKEFKKSEDFSIKIDTTKTNLENFSTGVDSQSSDNANRIEYLEDQSILRFYSGRISYQPSVTGKKFNEIYRFSADVFNRDPNVRISLHAIGYTIKEGNSQINEFLTKRTVSTKKTNDWINISSTIKLNKSINEIELMLEVIGEGELWIDNITFSQDLSTFNVTDPNPDYYFNDPILIDPIIENEIFMVTAGNEIIESLPYIKSLDSMLANEESKTLDEQKYCISIKVEENSLVFSLDGAKDENLYVELAGYISNDN